MTKKGFRPPVISSALQTGNVHNGSFAPASVAAITRPRDALGRSRARLSRRTGGFGGSG